MNAIELHDVSKRYRLGAREQSYVTLRETLGSVLRARGKSSGDELWAIRDMNLEVSERQVVGMIGRNGAGKSTLLKLITGITAPTAGVVRTRGRVGALLEVGTGFHPELTGRENVFLNASVLGMGRGEARRQFDEIVSFAGVERFIDTPLKRYSTGMRLRLAFSVAAHIRPSIIVVDEVLAVADIEFQRRCLGKMAELGANDRTVIFVSHDLGAIAQLCPRVLWIDAGSVVADGPPGPVIERYLASTVSLASQVDFRGSTNGPVELLDAAILDAEGNVEPAPRRDAALRIRIRFAVLSPVWGLDLTVFVHDPRGTRLLDEAWSDTAGGTPPRELMAGAYAVTLTIPPVLAVGQYFIGAWFGSVHEDVLMRDILRIEIRPSPGDRQEWSERPRALQPNVAWELQPLRFATSGPEALS